MQERCCVIDKIENGSLRRIDEIIAASMVRRHVMQADMDKKLAEIVSCPDPCVDGNVIVKLGTSGEECVELRVRCPLIGPDCTYGAKLQKQVDKRLAGLMISTISVPRRHITRFERYHATTATKEVTRWGMRGFFVLSGKTGCGKSFGAAWFVDRFFRSKIGDPYQLTAWEWHARAERAAYAITWSDAQGIVEDKTIAANAKSCSFLVIDDLGKECGLQSAQAIMRNVISKRYDNELPTIITTELTLSDIDARYGRAIAERIVGEVADGGKFITCGDESIRLIEKNNAA